MATQKGLMPLSSLPTSLDLSLTPIKFTKTFVKVMRNYFVFFLKGDTNVTPQEDWLSVQAALLEQLLKI